LRLIEFNKEWTWNIIYVALIFHGVALQKYQTKSVEEYLEAIDELIDGIHYEKNRKNVQITTKNNKYKHIPLRIKYLLMDVQEFIETANCSNIAGFAKKLNPKKLNEIQAEFCKENNMTQQQLRKLLSVQRIESSTNGAVQTVVSIQSPKANSPKHNNYNVSPRRFAPQQNEYPWHTPPRFQRMRQREKMEKQKQAQLGPLYLRNNCNVPAPPNRRPPLPPASKQKNNKRKRNKNKNKKKQKQKEKRDKSEQDEITNIITHYLQTRNEEDAFLYLQRNNNKKKVFIAVCIKLYIFYGLMDNVKSKNHSSEIERLFVRSMYFNNTLDKSDYINSLKALSSYFEEILISSPSSLQPLAKILVSFVQYKILNISNISNTFKTEKCTKLRVILNEVLKHLIHSNQGDIVKIKLLIKEAQKIRFNQHPHTINLYQICDDLHLNLDDFLSL